MIERSRMALSKEAIFEYIESYDYVSFAEIENKFYGVSKGDWSLAGPYENHFFWFSVTKEFCDIFCTLLAEKRIYLKPTEPLIYFIDGKVPDIAIAKRCIAYKTPRWIPIVLCPWEKISRESKKLRQIYDQV